MEPRWDDIDFTNVPTMGLPSPSPSGQEPPRLTLMAPMEVPAGTRELRRVGIPAPWGVSALGSITNVTASPEPILTIAYEWPFAPLGILPGLTRRESERLQLQVYSQDVWESTGSPPFTVTHEGDRPDFQVRNVQGVVGLDVTRLTSPIRRRAHNLFLRLKHDIEQDSHSYARFRGHMVNLWFAEGAIPGTAQPPKDMGQSDV